MSKYLVFEISLFSLFCKYTQNKLVFLSLNALRPHPYPLSKGEGNFL
jgi:hypothetical protein